MYSYKMTYTSIMREYYIVYLFHYNEKNMKYTRMNKVTRERAETE